MGNQFCKIVNYNKTNAVVDNSANHHVINVINKISKDDERYYVLQDIPEKEYHETDGITFVYLRINDTKDYFIVYKEFEIQIQILEYDIESETIYRLGTDLYEIK